MRPRPGWKPIEARGDQRRATWQHAASDWVIRPNGEAYVAISPTGELKAGPFHYLADAQEWVEMQIQNTPTPNEVLL